MNLKRANEVMDEISFRTKNNENNIRLKLSDLRAVINALADKPSISKSVGGDAFKSFEFLNKPEEDIYNEGDGESIADHSVEVNKKVECDEVEELSKHIKHFVPGFNNDYSSDELALDLINAGYSRTQGNRKELDEKELRKLARQCQDRSEPDGKIDVLEFIKLICSTFATQNGKVVDCGCGMGTACPALREQWIDHHRALTENETPSVNVPSVEEIEKLINNNYGDCLDPDCLSCPICSKNTAQIIHTLISGCSNKEKL